MWSAFARLAPLLALGVALAGCGPRHLDVSLTIDASGCALSLPAGGSVLYELAANGEVALDGGGGSFCGGCLALDTPIDSADALVAFLRTHAPSCGGVKPDTTLRVRVTGWSVAGCPPAPGGNPSFCAEAPSVLVPDGKHDATVMMNLACMAQCSAVCVPTTCVNEGKNCGLISDGCNAVLDCGTCKPPLRCGANTPNVCGK